MKIQAFGLSIIWGGGQSKYRGPLTVATNLDYEQLFIVLTSFAGSRPDEVNDFYQFT
jgi:hypothetical protein